MIRELEMVALAHDLPEHGLEAGDLGCVVMVHHGGKGYEVEFATIVGETLAVLTLRSDDVRSVKEHEIPHVREVA